MISQAILDGIGSHLAAMQLRRWVSGEDFMWVCLEARVNIKELKGLTLDALMSDDLDLRDYYLRQLADRVDGLRMERPRKAELRRSVKEGAELVEKRVKGNRQGAG